jgi:hypothetical protein
MGWLYYAPSKEALIQDLLDDCESEKLKRRSLDSFLVQEGDQVVLWSVAEITAKDNSTAGLKAGQVLKLICCDLLDRSGSTWGVKRLDEAMGPFYFSCPLRFLDMADELSTSWRESVRKFHTAGLQQVAACTA